MKFSFRGYMEEINFAECSGRDILAYLWVLYDAYVKVKDGEEKCDKIREECFELTHKLICLEKKLTRSEKAALKIENLKKNYSQILEKQYFAEMDLFNRKSFLQCVLERYKGLIDEKYIYDGTLSKVIDVFLVENVETVEQALKILEKG